MRFLTSTILTVGVIGMAGAASAAVIDFEDFDNGNLVTNVSSVDGTVTGTVTAERRDGGDPIFGQARIYDTELTALDNGYTGSDSDLEGPYVGLDGNQLGDQPTPGNVLIIDENVSDLDPIAQPNDNGGGGILTFEFDTNVLFTGVTFIDDGTLEVTGYLDGVMQGVSALFNNDEIGMFDRVFKQYSVIDWEVDKIVFDFGRNSGAIDDILVEAIAPVPVPASAFLLLGGLGGLAAVRRRRRRS